jgi:DNA-binding transcriptional LysR family regulator
MDLWQLSVFCKVIEQRSFSKAGRMIHLSQPTISSHVKDLEDHFGTRLIDRLSRKAIPTKAGELLYQYARRMMALRDETNAAMAVFLGEIKGRLPIGGSTIPGNYLLPKVIGAFTRQHPEVSIVLQVADTSQILVEVIEGRIELAVVGAPGDPKLVAQTTLIDDELRLVVPAGHRWARRKSVAWKDLKEEPFIVRERGSGTLRSIAQRLRESGHDVGDFKIAAEMGSTEAVRQAIKGKVGVSILSAVAVADDVRSGQLKALTVEGLNLKRSFYLTTHKQRSISPLGRIFRDFLIQTLHRQ